MKIAFVTLGFHPFRTSGFDISGERLVNALLDAGHSVNLIAAKASAIKETLAHPNLTIYRLPIGKTDWIGYSYRAANLLRRLEDVDIVHFWDVHFAFSYSQPYVASIHQSFRQRILALKASGLPDRKKSFRKIYYHLSRKLAEQSSSQRAAGLLAVSEATRNEFQIHYRIPPEKIALTRHGIDTNHFSPMQLPADLNSRIGVDLNKPIILFASFITPRKGLEYLARAYPHFYQKPNLIIVGKWRNENYREQIRTLLNKNVDEYIEAGFVLDQEMPMYYSVADIYVSPSLVEGFGLSLAEALACETPVVAFDSGSVAEVVGPGGILVPPKDVDGLVNAVNYLLMNPDVRKSMGKAGRTYVERNFSIGSMRDSTIAAYKRFLGVIG